MFRLHLLLTFNPFSLFSLSLSLFSWCSSYSGTSFLFSLLDTLPSPFLMSKRSFDRHLLRTQETEFKVKVGFFSSLKLFFVYLFFAYFFFVGDRTKSESTPSSSFLFLCFKKIRQRKRRLARSRVDRNKRRKEAEREGKKGVQKKKATRSKRSLEGSKTTACEGSQSFFLAIKEP